MTRRQKRKLLHSKGTRKAIRSPTVTAVQAMPSPVPWVPPELWRDIFRDASIKTLLALVLVCKDWHELANEFLYKTVRGSDSLLEAPEKSALRTQGPGYGKWVRRLVMPNRRLVRRVRFLDILQYCTQIDHLSNPYQHHSHADRPYNALFWEGLLHTQSGTCTPSAITSLASVRQVTWLVSGVDIEEYNPLERQALSEIILHSPNLRILRLVNLRSLEGGLFGSHTCHSPGTIVLPSLQNLRLMYASDISHLQVRAIDVPKLTQLDLLCLDHTLTSQALGALGEQLQSIDLEDCIPAHHLEGIWTILREFSNIREFTYMLRPFRLKLEGLLALHATFYLRIELMTIPTSVELQKLKDHLKALTHSTSTSLQRIILDGSWSETVERSYLLSLSALVHARGWPLEFANGTPI